MTRRISSNFFAPWRYLGSGIESPASGSWTPGQGGWGPDFGTVATSNDSTAAKRLQTAQTTLGWMTCNDFATPQPTCAAAVALPCPVRLSAAPKHLQISSSGSAGAGCRLRSLARWYGLCAARAAAPGPGECPAAVLQRFPTASNDCRRALAPCGVRAALNHSRGRRNTPKIMKIDGPMVRCLGRWCGL